MSKYMPTKGAGRVDLRKIDGWLGGLNRAPNEFKLAGPSALSASAPGPWGVVASAFQSPYVMLGRPDTLPDILNCCAYDFAYKTI